MKSKGKKEVASELGQSQTGLSVSEIIRFLHPVNIRNETGIPDSEYFERSNVISNLLVGIHFTLFKVFPGGTYALSLFQWKNHSGTLGS
jgi:hypothetical protein